MNYKAMRTIYLLLCNKVPLDLTLVGTACLKQQIFIVSISFWGSGIQSGLADSGSILKLGQDVGQHCSHQKGLENRFPSSHCWQEASVLCHSGLCTGLFTGHGIWFFPEQVMREREIQNGSDMPSLLLYAIDDTEQPWYNSGDYMRWWMPGGRNHWEPS